MAGNQVGDGIRNLLAAFRRRPQNRALGQGVGSAAANLFHVANDVRSTVSENGLVLLHIGSGLVFTANQTGARIWSEITQGACPATVGRGLSREYGAPIEQTTRDVAQFVSELVARGLLVLKRS
jgi:hypothetical protein